LIATVRAKNLSPLPTLKGNKSEGKFTVVGRRKSIKLKAFKRRADEFADIFERYKGENE